MILVPLIMLFSVISSVRVGGFLGNLVPLIPSFSVISVRLYDSDALVSVILSDLVIFLRLTILVSPTLSFSDIFSERIGLLMIQIIQILSFSFSAIPFERMARVLAISVPLILPLSVSSSLFLRSVFVVF